MGIGHLKNHLRLFDERIYDFKTSTYHKLAEVAEIYKDCEVVVIEIVQTETDRYDIRELIKDESDVQ